MRLRLLILPLAAFALIGADDVQEGGEAGEQSAAPTSVVISQEELAARMAQFKAPQPGQYNTTMEVLEFKFPGLDESLVELLRTGMNQTGQTTQSMCLSEEDAGQRMDEMLEGMTQGECTYSRFDVAGAWLDAEMQCQGEDGKSFGGQISGELDANGGDITLQMNFDDPTMGNGTISMHVVSERVGDCG